MESELSIRTAKGKEFSVRFCGATAIGMTSILYIEIIGKTMMDLVPVFSDKAETAVIEGLIAGDPVEQYRGYTNLTECNILADTGNIRIALQAPMRELGGGDISE